ncbi:tyrosine protein kinase, partial [Streptococcus alactolyticus]
TVESVLKGLNIAKIDIDRQARKFEGRISNAPLQEKEFLSIARQQEIKAALYTMLLQKREENAITLAATANNGRIIEDALADKDP